jgi:REP element-mobilizing transposase RayT
LFFITINVFSRGSDVLVHRKTPELLLSSARHYHDSGIWWLRLIMIMPDHLHALLALPPDRQLDRTIVAWKSYQTKRMKIEWPSGFFDHRLRSDESLDEKANYIRMNPVRAGLVNNPKDWPHSWSPD